MNMSRRTVRRMLERDIQLLAEYSDDLKQKGYSPIERTYALEAFMKGIALPQKLAADLFLRRGA